MTKYVVKNPKGDVIGIHDSSLDARESADKFNTEYQETDYSYEKYDESKLWFKRGALYFEEN